MSCPTCDHTMQTILATDDCRRHWCPRCGTLRTVFFTFTGGDTISDDVPILVERCRSFEKFIHEPGKRAGEIIEWKCLGIAESINKPEDRPQ